MGLDIGSSGTRGVVTTSSGVIVATARCSHSVSYPHPRWAEVDASAAWWRDLMRVTGELTDQVDRREIAAVSVSGAGPCLLITDGNLEPVAPAILYGVDARTALQIAELRTRLGETEVFERCGKALTSQAVGPKMVWMRENLPEAWRRGEYWFTSHNYAVAKLTGEYALDHNTASQCNPLYDVRAGEWAADWASEIVGHLPLPRLVWPTEPVGVVTETASAATGIPVGTPVVSGMVDAWAEAMAAGVGRPHDLLLVYGSAMSMVYVLDGYWSHPALWTTKGLRPGQYTLAAGIATSGAVVQWLRELMGNPSYESLISEAGRVAAGSEGLIVLPDFAGERVPSGRTAAPGALPSEGGLIAGLSLRHGRGHLLRATYEGIAYSVKGILDLMESGAGPAVRVVALGGGTQSRLWTQIVSDVTQREQFVPNMAVGASYGAALIAGVATGYVAPDTEWASTGRLVTPRPELRDTYARLFERFQNLESPPAAGVRIPGSRGFLGHLDADQGPPSIAVYQGAPTQRKE